MRGWPDASTLACAVRRYPDVSPPLAVEFLASDRRAAGLGALDERKRRRDSPEGRTKRYEPFYQGQEHIVYEMRSYRRAHYERPKFALPLSPRYMAAESTETVTLIPERELCLRRVVGVRELQEDRRRIAHFLRGMRRDMRAAKAANP